jgi:hypothetical protein
MKLLRRYMSICGLGAHSLQWMQAIDSSRAAYSPADAADGLGAVMCLTYTEGASRRREAWKARQPHGAGADDAGAAGLHWAYGRGR